MCHFSVAASKVSDDKAAAEAQEMEVMARTAAAAVQVLAHLGSNRAVVFLHGQYHAAQHAMGK